MDLIQHIDWARSCLSSVTSKTATPTETKKATIIVRIMLCIVLAMVVGSNEIRAEQEYLFVGQENYAPFNMVDDQGKLTGLDVEIVQKAAEVAGAKVKIMVYPWAGTLKLVRNGKADGVFGCGKKPDREEFLYYPEIPVRYVKFSFFVNEHFEGTIKGVKDIGNREVGVVRGYFVSKEFNDDPTILKDYANNTEQLLRQVSVNRRQIAVYSRIAGAYELKRLGITNLHAFLYKDAPTYPSYLAFSKASPRGKEAYKVFSNALKQLKKEGVLDEIYQKYSQF